MDTQTAQLKAQAALLELRDREIQALRKLLEEVRAQADRPTSNVQVLRAMCAATAMPEWAQLVIQNVQSADYSNAFVVLFRACRESCEQETACNALMAAASTVDCPVP